jgi:hypothetical protein
MKELEIMQQRVVDQLRVVQDQIVAKKEEIR